VVLVACQLPSVRATVFVDRRLVAPGHSHRCNSLLVTLCSWRYSYCTRMCSIRSCCVSTVSQASHYSHPLGGLLLIPATLPCVYSCVLCAVVGVVSQDYRRCHCHPWSTCDCYGISRKQAHTRSLAPHHRLAVEPNSQVLSWPGAQDTVPKLYIAYCVIAFACYCCGEV
jgi:hypothetical protein